MADEPNEWLPVPDPEPGHSVECGCGLPEGVAFSITVMQDGRVAFGRKVDRSFVTMALRQIMDAVELAQSVDDIERDMEGP